MLPNKDELIAAAQRRRGNNSMFVDKRMSGNYRFRTSPCISKGRLLWITGPKGDNCFVSIILMIWIFLTMGTWAYLTKGDDNDSNDSGTATIHLLLSIVIIVCKFRCNLVDPGIILRNVKALGGEL